MADFELVRRPVPQHRRGGEAEDLVAAVVLEGGIVGRAVVALQLVVLGEHVSHPPEAEMVVAGQLKVAGTNVFHPVKSVVRVRDGQRRRVCRKVEVRGLLLEVALHVDEPERLVPDDWSARTSAEHVAGGLRVLPLPVSGNSWSR